MASGYRGYPGYPGYLLPFFMGKMLLIIFNILLNSYIYHNFRKKHTLGNRGNRGNHNQNISYSTTVTSVTPVTPCIFSFSQISLFVSPKYPFYLRFPLKVLFFHEFSLYYTAILTTKYNINSKNQYAKKVLI